VSPVFLLTFFNREGSIKSANLSQGGKTLYASDEAPDRGIPHDHIASAIVRNQPPKSPKKLYWESFGRKIKKRQEEKGLSNQKLAELADISMTTLNRVKAGALVPTDRTIKGLADALLFPFITADHRNPR
jgi:ribosome-binding protein aMBF1 (putative translation factor)